MTFRKELAIIALLLGAVLTFAQPSDRLGPVAAVSGGEQVIR